MYTIQTQPFGNLVSHQLLHTQTGAYASVLPGYGGMILELVLPKNRVLHSVLKGCATAEQFMTYGKKGFFGAQLFPFPGRVRGATYAFDGETYMLALNDRPPFDHAIHGTVYNQSFRVETITSEPTFAELTLTYNSEGTDGYPFRYQLTNTYRLDKRGFSCRTTIRNRDDRPIPVGHGWHPYLKADTSANAVSVNLDSRTSLVFDEVLIPTGDVVDEATFLNGGLITPAFIHACFKLIPNEGIHQTTVYNPGPDLTTVVWQETGPGQYTYVQLFVPADRHSIAVEPFTCPPNAFNSGIGLNRLAPGQTQQLAMGISIY